MTPHEMTELREYLSWCLRHLAEPELLRKSYRWRRALTLLRRAGMTKKEKKS